MSAMYWNEEEKCWYIPVGSPILLAELEEGIEPVNIKLRDGQLVITRLGELGGNASET